MNPNIKIFLLCPVPEDQKPLNEYINLKENKFLNWAFLPIAKYRLKIVSNFFIYFPIVLIFCLNLTPLSFINIVKFFLISSTIFFLILYMRWSEVNKKLKNSRVFYEEASWFDGKIWEKPFFLIKNDKLLSSQKVQPVIKKLKLTIFLTILFNLYVLNF